jgi:hypothetical protein
VPGGTGLAGTLLAPLPRGSPLWKPVLHRNRQILFEAAGEVLAWCLRALRHARARTMMSYRAAYKLLAVIYREMGSVALRLLRPA